MYNEIGEIWLIHVNAMAKVFGKFIGAALAVMAVIWVGTGQALAQLHSDEDLGVYKQTEVFRQGDLDLDGGEALQEQLIHPVEKGSVVRNQQGIDREGIW